MMKKATILILLILATVTINAQVGSSDLIAEIFPHASKGVINGTYIYINEDAATIIAHAGLENKAVSLTMFGSTGAIGVNGRVIHLNSREQIFINNRELVIGEPDSGGEGLRSVSVRNDPQRFSFDGQEIEFIRQ